MGMGIKNNNENMDKKDKTDWVDYNGVYLPKMSAAAKKAWVSRKKNITPPSGKRVYLYFHCPNLTGNVVTIVKGFLVCFDPDWIIIKTSKGTKHFVPFGRVYQIVEEG